MSPRPIALVPRELALPAGTPADNLTAAFRHLLVSGSDTRLHVDPARQLNGYGCRPFPRPEAVAFSSSTASTLSERGYAAAERAFLSLCEAAATSNFEQAFAQLCEQVRSSIGTLLVLENAAVVLSPSGTDSAMQALLLARRDGPLTSIVVGADETGSGVTLASAAKHFNALASAGLAVDQGQALAGLEDVASVAIAAQDGAGMRSLAAIDAEVRGAVASAVAAGRRAVLYVMDHSKIGGRYPSAPCLDAIVAEHGDAVQVVIDACQARVSRRRLQAMLDRGFLVLITGSKFFGGPPLSGALLVPASRTFGMRALPAGFSAYSSCYDWPAELASIRDQLPARANVGELLRWTAAIVEMRDYFAVPELIRRIMLAEFSASVERAIASHPCCRLLPAPQWLDDDTDAGEFSARTIFPFVMLRDGRPLSLAQSRNVHRLLNEDIADRAFGAIAASLCHVGQPVAIADGTTGALRISADARLVSESWTGDLATSMERLRGRCRGIATVFDKVDLILAHALDT